MKRKVWLYIAIGIIIFILGGVLMPRHNVKSSQAATDSQPTSDEVAQVQDEPAMFGLTSINGVPVISAEELYEAFENNDVAANKKYGGKTYCVKGVIKGFQTSLVGDDPIVELDSDQFYPVYCYFSKRNEDEVASLSKGEKVIIQGVVENAIISVHVNKCKIIR